MTTKTKKYTNDEIKTFIHRALLKRAQTRAELVARINKPGVYAQTIQGPLGELYADGELVKHYGATPSGGAKYSRI